MPASHEADVGTGCLIVLALLALVFALSAFYGWVIMLVAGACGWHVGYWPSVGLGFLLGLVTSRVSTTSS